MPVTPGATPTEVNFDSSTLTAPAGRAFVTWQAGASVPDPNNPEVFVRDVSAHVDAHYDVVFSLPGKPSDGTTYLIVPFARTVVFPANFSGSVGKVLANPAAAVTWTLKKNGSSCGTIQVDSSGNFTFASTGGAAVTFNAGDYLEIATPSPQDSTLADFAVTLAGVKQ